MTDITFRSARQDDAEPLGKIAFDAFSKISKEHNFPPDFPSPLAGAELMRMMISRPHIFSVVAENGSILGSNFLWEGDEVAGVGPITVDPEVQDRSIGRMMMEEVIRRADVRGKISVRLVQAAYHNRSLALYTKLGFDTVEPLSCIAGPPTVIRVQGRSVRTMQGSDVDAASKLCIAVHGISRKNEIAESVIMGTARVVEAEGRITGYFTQLGFFGHAVAETDEDLIALIGSGEEIQGTGFLLPTRNANVMRKCLDNGLRIVQPLTLMSRGLYSEPRGAFMPSILY